MMVLDASVAVEALLNRGSARAAIARNVLHAPHLIDSEVAHVLRRRVQSGQLPEAMGRRALDTWVRLGLLRHPTYPLLSRIWRLRDDLSAYEAGYVALAESLGCDLMTVDARIARAPGLRCTVVTVPV